MHLDRLVAILEAVAVAGRAVTAVEVQAATGLPRPTCYRLLQSLADHRLLDCEDNAARYVIGHRLTRIALLGQSDTDVRSAATPAMRETANLLGEAVFLARFREKSVEIVHVETPSDPTRSYVHPGLGRRPFHACSCSKAIAAFAEPDFRETILGGPMRAYTAHTKTSRSEIESEFAAIVERGYAECVEEMEIGVSSVASPVRIRNTSASFSIGATGPVRRFNAGARRRIGDALVQSALKVAAAIQLKERSLLPPAPSEQPRPDGAETDRVA